MTGNEGAFAALLESDLDAARDVLLEGGIDPEDRERIEKAYAAVLAARARRDAAAAEVERLANAGPDDDLDADLREMVNRLMKT